MVAAEDFGADVGFLEARAEGLREEKVVDAPADVPGAGAGHGTPPAVMTAALFKFPEGVHETGVHEVGETGAFLDGETVVADVGLGVRQVEFAVGHVEVAAEDDRFLAFELFQVFQKIGVPDLAIGEALQFALGVGDVNVDEVEVIEFGGLHAAFAVVLGDVDVRRDLKGALAGEDGGAGVAFLLGAVPIGGIGGGPELLDLVGGALGLLEAEDIRLFRLEVFEKVLFEDGAETVDVPGDQFHAGRIKLWRDGARFFYTRFI